LRQTASFNPFPNIPTEQEIEAKLAQEDHFRLLQSPALDETQETFLSDVNPRSKSLLRNVANPLLTRNLNDYSNIFAKT
jgi:hypothetical protein